MLPRMKKAFQGTGGVFPAKPKDRSLAKDFLDKIRVQR